MKKVLIIEDNRISALSMKVELFGHIVVSAFDLPRAEELFAEEGHSFDAVIMDACVPGNVPNSMYLVKKMRETGYAKPIIASSTESEFRKMLLMVGASHEAEKDKAARLANDLLSKIRYAS